MFKVGQLVRWKMNMADVWVVKHPGERMIDVVRDDKRSHHATLPANECVLAKPHEIALEMLKNFADNQKD